jgi:hypothetical protein
MRVGTIVLVAFVAATAWTAPGSSVAAAGCVPRETHTSKRDVIVAKGSRVAVVQEVTTFRDGTSLVDSSVCHRPTGRRTTTGHDPVSYYYRYFAPHTVAIAGDYAAFSWDEPEGDEQYAGVLLVDAATGRAKNATLAVDATFGRFRRIVLKPSGGLAWSERHRIFACPSPCLPDDPLGFPQPQKLARGLRVDGESLRGTATGIAWREGSRRRRANLR